MLPQSQDAAQLASDRTSAAAEKAKHIVRTGESEAGRIDQHVLHAGGVTATTEAMRARTVLFEFLQETWIQGSTSPSG